MNLQEILQSIQAGKSLSKEQTDYVISSLGKGLAGKVPASDSGMSLEEFMSNLTPAIDALRKSPEGQANLKQVLADRRTQRFVKQYTPFFNAILAGADINTSLSQVRNSNKAIKNLVRPGLPAVPLNDPALNDALRGAQVGTMDAARAIGPARQELQDQYAKDIALAKSIGGGQSSTLGALGQVASLRRARGAAALAPQIDAIRAREQGRVDNLLGMRQQQSQQNFYNRKLNSDTALNQYGLDLQSAGQLGSTGRLNLRNSMSSLLGAVPGVAARIGQGYNDKYSQYEQALNQSLTNQNPRQQYAANPFGAQYGTQDDSLNYFLNR
jgi:hypothetical protein